MDKRKAIEAYRSGLITARECAQILGLEKPELLGLVPEAELAAHSAHAAGAAHARLAAQELRTGDTGFGAWSDTAPLARQ
ncbi:hypothetical protein [Cohnella sp. 56]|uniref:hypothetical protein n=1 Tax=Cohnella sp. 56 TaxID=3113722 RepID=UPI0030E91998